ncbi:MAG: rhodanese-like domain-containing protein [Pseudohongiellaceae bacterium]
MRLTMDLIIEAQELEANLDNPDLLVVDVCQPQTYARIHIPGAVHVAPGELVCGIAPASGKLPELEQLNALFSRIGYRPDQHIVVYDDEGGGWAGRFIWTLDVIGHRHYSYLNGGLHAWYKEQHPVSAEPAAPGSTPVNLSIDTSVIAEIPDIMNALGDDGVKIWDARSHEEFIGARLSSRRGGHIPGAVNLDWLETLDKDRNLRLLPLEVLRSKLDDLGIHEDDEIITHCQTHHRSGLTYLVAKALGHKARGYHGSWAEWGNLDDTPVET